MLKMSHSNSTPKPGQHPSPKTFSSAPDRRPPSAKNRFEELPQPLVERGAGLLTQGYLTAKQVKARFSISNSTLWSWVAGGLFPKPVKVGPRAVRFRAEDLRRFEAGLETANNNDATGGSADGEL